MTDVCGWWVAGAPCDCALDEGHDGDHMCSCGQTFGSRTRLRILPPGVVPLPDDLKGHR